MLKLSDCKQGDNVKIIKVQGTGLLRKRLLEMGFIKGAEISIVKYAPLRDPMEITIGDAHISLRLQEAALINVEKTGET